MNLMLKFIRTDSDLADSAVSIEKPKNMNKYDPPQPPLKQLENDKLLMNQVQKVVSSENLDDQRQLVNAIAAELQVSLLDCAAAITYLYGLGLGAVVAPKLDIQYPQSKQRDQEKPLITAGMKFVRYRLNLGNEHSVELSEIKKVLVEESGVDVKNISNVRIMDTYTLIDLPDAMPQDIFHHLKTIEINGQKLDIRRVKHRNKRRSTRKFRHSRLGSV